MKKALLKIVAVILSLVLLSGMTTGVFAEEKGFLDVAFGSWYCDAVHFDAALGIIHGVGSGRFAPNTSLNRAMAVTMLYRLEGSLDVGTSDNPFTDVPDGCYYENAVRWGVSKGIVRGTGKNTFAPEQAVTREQLACFIIRYAESVQADFLVHGDHCEQSFVDRNDASAYAIDAMDQMVSFGIYEGDKDGRMRPKATASRAEIAVVFCRLALLLDQLPEAGTVTDVNSGTDVSLSTKETAWFFQGLTQRSSWKETEPFDFVPDYRLTLWGTEYMFSKDSSILGFNCIAPDGTTHGMLCTLERPEKEMNVILRKLSECSESG